MSTGDLLIMAALAALLIIGTRGTKMAEAAKPAEPARAPAPMPSGLDWLPRGK